LGDASAPVSVAAQGMQQVVIQRLALALGQERADLDLAIAAF